ncbi:hypothetical protein DNX69_14300 [Rhodopseudomonas palustris]|uniref:Uncharacterized protein n=1 Tax=Rhodopseudomonas palustris TaxID=1076 RepID=A0A323UDQ0_RHOPL|nr:hypothetical protein [Rhodopseudomonas palustris]PZA10531.1 hypothetical protein DNX69_14300 [Rhodopseudomonas palustris]
MTKAFTLSALACVLLASASAASILARASVPAAGSAGVAAIELPIANRNVKADKLEIAQQQPETAELAAAQEPAAEQPVEEQTAAATAEPSTSAKPLQLAYATDDLPVAAIPEAAPSEPSAAPKATSKLPPVIATAPVHRPKPKPAAKEALLSDGQIAKIKTRLNLSSSQEYYWPSVEQALRAIGRKLHSSSNGRDSGTPMIDPDSAEVQQLKYAAMPLLFQLREDQKQEVRKLARAMGLEQVAQQI